MLRTLIGRVFAGRRFGARTPSRLSSPGECRAMLAAVRSATLRGIDGCQVTVEIHVSNGLPSYTVVGLPDASCRESRDRVRAAVLSCDHPWPSTRITVNLAPTGVPKAGAGLDLAIAVGILAAAGVLPPAALEGMAFLGELGLDGAVRPVLGAVPLVGALGAVTTVVAAANAAHARLVAEGEVRGVSHLNEVVAALKGAAPWPDLPVSVASPEPRVPPPDLADVRGNSLARKALEISAAGRHHLLMVGPPGSGKTMLARRLPGLLPELDRADALMATRIHSAAGETLPIGGLLTSPPLRAPHHGLSSVAMVGGGTGMMRPGEISLATGGVLFLDELGEFQPSALDALRQPLEEGVVRVSRAHSSVTFPARFLLVGAMNPCPCGFGGGPGFCRCSDSSRARYHRRVSGPLLDRFDLRIDVQRPAAEELLRGAPGEPSATVAVRVAAVRARARARGVSANAALSGPLLDRHAPLDDAAAGVLEGALRDGRISARGLTRLRSVARTIADLDEIDGGPPGPLRRSHVALALALRASLPMLEGWTNAG